MVSRTCLGGRRVTIRWPKRGLPFAMASILAAGCLNVMAEGTKPAGRPAVDGGPLDQMLQEVEIALQKAQDILATGGLPPLKSVELTLRTSVTKDASGKIKIIVITIGGGPSAANMQEIALTLV